MLKVGIDAISLYTPNYYIDLRILAEKRNLDVDKIYSDLGQKAMAVLPPDEDAVTMGLNAVEQLLQDHKVNKNEISTILFATESGVDCSKASGMYVHEILGFPSNCRVVELKQACYSGTAGLQLGLSLLYKNPQHKIIVVASDIARYQLNSTPETSQGCGAIAMLLSVDPKLMVIENEYGVYTKEVMDFWRPLYSDVAFVDGKLSCDTYFKFLEESWQDYFNYSRRDFLQHDYFCYHTPVPKMVELAHKRLARLTKVNKQLSLEQLNLQIQTGLIYSRQIGNIYTASLYLGVLSLLENTVDVSSLANKRLGLYSYGSGSIGEYFSGIVQENYVKHLPHKSTQQYLEQRNALSYQEYEDWHNYKLPHDGSLHILPTISQGKFRLTSINNHQRYYVESYYAKE